MKISIFAGVLLISAAVIFVDGQSWSEFYNKHINAGMTDGQCTDVMRKPFNTFITGNVDAVQAVCGEGGAPYGNGYVISYDYFKIVDCYLVHQNPPAVPPNCYYRGDESERRIIVRCENGEPVHFHGSQEPVARPQS
uniref:Ribonuclease A-domain domain-containing protein n=1 Tax=Sander lucioperca TaxID=283035 RepID=A0A8C9XAV8_SANLU